MNLIAAVILAGGASRRFGRPKALARIGQRAALDCVVEAAREGGCDPILTVVGRDGEAIRTGLKGLPTSWITNPDSERGQTSSLQAGLMELTRAGNPAGAAFFLVDHPFVNPGSVRILIEKFRENPARPVRPVFGKRGGHPTLIPSGLFPEILGLPPAESVRSVLFRDGRMTDVAVKDEGVIAAFDTEEQYLELLRRFG